MLDDGENYKLEEEFISEGAVVHKLDGIWIRGIRDFKSYKKSMERFFKNHHDYEVVHMHSSSKNFYLLYYAKKYGVPIEDAIKVITENVAAFLKLESKGNIASGKAAYIVIVNTDTL